MITEQKITIEEKTYTAKFPNMRQFSEIEQRKMILSDGRYPLMALNANTGAGKIALDFIDAIAYLSILCPNIVPDMGFKSFVEMMEMDYHNAQKLISVFNEQFVPFYDQFVERDKIPFRPESGNTQDAGQGQQQ